MSNWIWFVGIAVLGILVVVVLKLNDKRKSGVKDLPKETGQGLAAQPSEPLAPEIQVGAKVPQTESTRPGEKPDNGEVAVWTPKAPVKLMDDKDFEIMITVLTSEGGGNYASTQTFIVMDGVLWADKGINPESDWVMVPTPIPVVLLDVDTYSHRRPSIQISDGEHLMQGFLESDDTVTKWRKVKLPGA
jgi:hypothetical protein